MIIVTLGSNGVLVSEKSGDVKHFPAHKVDPSFIKSTVGSGDSFLGGFIAGLHKGMNLSKCIELG